jgi:flagellar hook-basal body complex protein FliE
MSQMEISKVLTQMRALASELHAPLTPSATPGAGSGPAFGSVLADALASVSSQQEAANTLARNFELGTGDASIAEVMVSMQKASLSFEAVTQVRNRLVEAYRDIMNMPI